MTHLENWNFESYRILKPKMWLCIWLFNVAPGHKGIPLIHRQAIEIIFFFKITPDAIAPACPALASQGKIHSTMRYQTDSEVWSTEGQYVPCSSVSQFANSDLSRERVLQDPDAGYSWTLYNSATVPWERQGYFMFTYAFNMDLICIVL